MSEIKPEKSKKECTRCGTCCKKGGPTFHLDDKALIEEGEILSTDIFTIRQGEPSYDNVRDRFIPAESDIIKMKGQRGSWTCRFFDAQKNACRIYDVRPLECRVLKCWDTREIERVYSKNRLTRKDLVSRVEGLWELVESHQEKCAYPKIKHLVDEMGGPHEKRAQREILDLIAYDAEVRKLVVQKGGLDPETLEFLFGRPLEKTIGMYGFKVEKRRGRYALVRANPDFSRT